MSPARPVAASCLGLILCCLVAAPTVEAQVEAGIGSRVRITSPEFERGNAVGVLERSSADTVVLSGKRLNRQWITRVEVSTGRKSHPVTGAAVGLAVGAGLGAGIACAAQCGNDSSNDGESGLIVGYGAVVGGALGALVGGLIGAVTHTDQWQTASLGTLSLHPIPGINGSFGITVGLRF